MRHTPLLATVLLLAGCSGVTRYSGTPGAAVVVYEPSRAADAVAVREILVQRGWRAETAESGPARRTRSSVAIYAQRRHTGRGADLADALRPAAGELDVLPFMTDGPGRHDAVVWLAEAGPR